MSRTSETYQSILKILNDKQGSKSKRLKQYINEIIQGDFIQDISFSSDKTIKTYTFFEEKKQLFTLIPKLPIRIREKVLFTLCQKLYIAIPQEIRAFRYPGPMFLPSCDGPALKFLMKTVKDDLVDTRKHLTELLELKSVPKAEQAISKLLQMIPSDVEEWSISESANNYFEPQIQRKKDRVRAYWSG